MDRIVAIRIGDGRERVGRHRQFLPVPGRHDPGGPARFGRGGRVYAGNQFDQGESVPDAPSNDSINNVEAVHLSAPLPGEYVVRVRARNVVEDARIDTPAVDQDFALVVSSDLPLPGVGVLFFDRSAYRVPDVIKVKLIDPDLGGLASVDVLITSSTETNGALLTRVAAGPLGVFTSTVATVTGCAV